MFTLEESALLARLLHVIAWTGVTLAALSTLYCYHAIRQSGPERHHTQTPHAAPSVPHAHS